MEFAVGTLCKISAFIPWRTEINSHPIAKIFQMMLFRLCIHMVAVYIFLNAFKEIIRNKICNIRDTNKTHSRYRRSSVGKWIIFGTELKLSINLSWFSIPFHSFVLWRSFMLVNVRKERFVSVRILNFNLRLIFSWSLWYTDRIPATNRPFKSFMCWMNELFSYLFLKCTSRNEKDYLHSSQGKKKFSILLNSYIIYVLSLINVQDNI